MFHNILNALYCNSDADGNNHRLTIKGTVVLMKKNVLILNDLGASIMDRLSELVGDKFSLGFGLSFHYYTPLEPTMLRSN
ncbi:hypothetical protein K1719_032267 [Acacia pycnantha]|nr:hypothetical protein K1719_032267 [Acacia pycnantha]